jgi:zinc transport system substrate-binding protein
MTNMRIIFILALVLSASVAAGCSNDSSSGSDADAPPTVVASLYPFQWLAERVLNVDAGEVANLTPTGAEAHDLELGPRDIEQLHDADVVVYVRGLQPAVDDAIDSAPDSLTAINVLEIDGVTLRSLTEAEQEAEAGHSHGAEDEAHSDEKAHSEDEAHADEKAHSKEEIVDPHVWLDPVIMQRVAEHLETQLAKAGFDDADASDVVESLTLLDGEYSTRLATCERRDVITAHAAFGYVGDRYKLRMRPIAGLSPEGELRPQDLEAVAEVAEQTGATTIWFETLTSPAIAETIAREVDAQVAVLDPLEGLTSDALESGATYDSVMRDNLDSLEDGLGCDANEG